MLLQNRMRFGLTVLSLAACVSASAGFTSVGSSGSGTAPQTDILAALYGGSFTGEDGQFSNGTVTVERVADFDAAKTDQVWDAGKYVVRSVAKFTSAEAAFYADVPNTPELHVGDVGVDLTKSIELTADESFSWAARDYYGTHSSDVSLNEDNADHFVTYEVKGTSAATKYVLFWEDLPQTPDIRKTNKTWNDFNDLAVEVQSLGSAGAVIPLPPAVFASGVTVGMIGIGNFLRKRFGR